MPLPFVAINARAAVRPEIGGVERVAREMVARLPRERYRVYAPPAALAHKAGHLWEQLALPLVPAELIYCPANLAPLASRRNVVVIHDVAALRHPEWYSKPYVASQKAVLPLISRRARLVITVSECSGREIQDVLGVDATLDPNGVEHRFKPGPKKDYALVVGSKIARKNLAALDGLGMEVVAAGSGRGYMKGE